MNGESARLGRAIIVFVVSFAGISSYGVTGRSIVDFEILRCTHQLETIVIITELQVFVSGEVFSVFVHIIVTDRHEVRVVGCTVAVVELELLCHNLKAPC